MNRMLANNGGELHQLKQQSTEINQIWLHHWGESLLVEQYLYNSTYVHAVLSNRKPWMSNFICFQCMCFYYIFLCMKLASVLKNMKFHSVTVLCEIIYQYRSRFDKMNNRLGNVFSTNNNFSECQTAFIPDVGALFLHLGDSFVSYRSTIHVLLCTIRTVWNTKFCN